MNRIISIRLRKYVQVIQNFLSDEMSLKFIHHCVYSPCGLVFSIEYR